MTVTASSNYSDDGTEVRSDKLIFALDSGEGEASVSISQDGCEPVGEEPEPEPEPEQGTISIDQTSLTFAVEGETLKVSVTANAAWTAEGPDWLTISPNSGDSDTTVQLTASDNYYVLGSDSREGTVKFSLTSGEEEVTLEISQEGHVWDTDIVWFSEDWEWWAEWTEHGTSTPAGDCITQDSVYGNSSGENYNYAPNWTSLTVDGVTLFTEMLNRGYTLLSVSPTGSYSWTKGDTSYDTNCAASYVQMNYPRLGRTGWQGGIIMPPFENIPPREACLKMSIDWCPIKNDSGVYETVNPVIEFETDGVVVEVFVTPLSFADNTPMTWYSEEFDLTEAGVTINESTKLTFKQKEWGVSTQNRWVFDNVVIYTEVGDVIE